MTLTSNDITFVYSGGQNNLDPSKSLGGSPSNNVLSGLANNLFTNLKKEEFASQFVDFRCFYICNNSFSDTLYNSSVYLESQISGVSNCQLGIAKSTDEQIIQLNSIPNSGSIKLKYESYTTSSILWNSNNVAFRKNIQEALNNLDIFSGVTVGDVGNNSFLISFLGSNNYRNYSLLQVAENNLSPSTTIDIAKRTEGEPINSIAPLLPTKTTIPNNVDFYETSESYRILIGDLHPGDVVPIWVKRSSFGQVSEDQTNGFAFRVSGNLTQNPTQIITSASKPCFYYE